MALYLRDEVDKAFKWKLEDIFSDNDAWEECFFAVSERIPAFSRFQDKLASDDVLLECLTAKTALAHDLSKLYQYAHMRRDEDTRVTLYQGMNDRAEQLLVKYSVAQSFVVPEIAGFEKEKLIALKNNKKFSDYSVFFEDIIRQKDIILSKKEEKILSELGIFADSNEEVFSMFDNADVKFRSVRDDKGDKVEMSHGIYSLLLQSPEQKVRKAAFDSMFEAYRDHINMLAANYAGNVKKDWFFAKIRGFASSLDSSVYAENVSPVCYKKLLDAVNKGTEELHRYIALRKRCLGVKTLNMYDLHVPIVAEQNLAMPYEKAVETVKAALKPMGKEYDGILSSSFTDGWIDVYENKGKRSGAYSWGCYGVHPFVLLNYQQTTHDVFTIAHELGHALHSYYSNSAQPETKAGYEIFVAEIASTVNEVLLLKHLLKSARGDMRKYLLSYYLDMFRTTLFRQTMFAEFEAAAHGMAERGEPLTADAFCEEYLALNKKYYGKAVKHNDYIKYEWARIPHFYTSFYVYKYATGLTSAVSIAANITEQGDKYFAKYREFLSAGGSMPPLDILRLAGVDLETDEPYERAMREFSDTLRQLEELIAADEK